MSRKIVIIGGGISGCSIAYNLALKGEKRILVLDKGYLTSGSTGRCGAGIRQQWATPLNCILGKKSIEFFEHAKETLGYDEDIEFKQEGYLILATTTEEHEQFAKNVKLQNSLGIPSKHITKEEAKQIVPHINTDSFISATFCQTDGHLNPFHMTNAYLKAAKRLGATFHFNEEVIDIKTVGNKVTKVITNLSSYDCDILINAAGGYAKEIGDLVGVGLPVYAENHEILVTEPIEKMQGPMVMSFSKNIYCQQVPHGSFIMGRSDPDVEKSHDISSSWKFLDEMSKTVTEILPLIGELRVIRTWGGSYCMSPDRQPIIGGCDEYDNFFMAVGFSGHGFMFAPMTGLLLAEIILNQPTTLPVEELCLSRFKHNKIETYEKSVV